MEEGYIASGPNGWSHAITHYAWGAHGNKGA